MLQKYFDFLNAAEAGHYKVRGPKDMPEDLLPDHDLCVITHHLNHKFKRKYTMEEVSQLLLEEKIPQTKPVIDYVPQWYKDKWF
jgi:hypothetical protein